VKDLRAPGGIPVKESKEKHDQAPAGKLLLDFEGKKLASVKPNELRFFE
jgi:hypothetical protein